MQPQMLKLIGIIGVLAWDNFSSQSHFVHKYFSIASKFEEGLYNAMYLERYENEYKINLPTTNNWKPVVYTSSVVEGYLFWKLYYRALDNLFNLMELKTPLTTLIIPIIDLTILHKADTFESMMEQNYYIFTHLWILLVEEGIANNILILYLSEKDTEMDWIDFVNLPMESRFFPIEGINYGCMQELIDDIHTKNRGVKITSLTYYSENIRNFCEDFKKTL